jgi:UDP-N-acetylglucosamine 2-epimerase
MIVRSQILTIKFYKEDNLNKLKVMTVVGTRPEIIRLSAVIHRLEETKAIHHVLVHTGQNYDYELNEIFFRDLNLKKPDYFLGAAGKTSISTIGNILIKIDEILEIEKPDAFLVLGDTNSCVSAIAAKKRQIPIFHMEAGNRCFDNRVPEETNRKLVDHIADINLPYSDIGREYLLREGIAPDRIIKTGSPMYEVLHGQLENINKSNILDELSINIGEYFVVSAHREENIEDDNNFTQLMDSMNSIADKYRHPIIFSTHPRTKKRLDERKVLLSPLIRIMKPFGFHDYIKLQMNAKAVLSDSGTISEETSILRLRSLNMRQSHERLEAMEEATVMMVGLGKDRILQGISILEEETSEIIKIVKDYDVTNVSDKVVKIILSYTDYANRIV